MLLNEVSLELEVGHSLVEVPAFEAVADAGELFILPLNFGDDGASVGFKLGTPLVVTVVL
jgi:hypothetical protein